MRIQGGCCVCSGGKSPTYRSFYKSTGNRCHRIGSDRLLEHTARLSGGATCITVQHMCVFVVPGVTALGVLLQCSAVKGCGIRSYIRTSQIKDINVHDAVFPALAMNLHCQKHCQDLVHLVLTAMLVLLMCFSEQPIKCSHFYNWSFNFDEITPWQE